MRTARCWVRAAAAAMALWAGCPDELPAQPTAPPSSYCPAPDLRIGAITVERLDVFESVARGPARWVASGANALHSRTRETVVRRELLFREGDRCDDEALGQTERNLRALGLFRQAEVLVLPAAGDTVDLLVRVRDAFSLRVSAGYRREGGADDWDARFGETNLAGLGHSLSLRRSHDFERDVASVAFFDPRLFGSRERLAVAFDRRSDGQTTQVSLARPFHTVNARWSHDIAFNETRDHLRLYDAGTVTREWERRAVDASAGVAFRLNSRGHDQAWRVSAGYRYQTREYWDASQAASLFDCGPTPRRLAGPYAGLHFLSHRYVKRTGLVAPERDIDLNLGLAADIGVMAAQRLRVLDTEPLTVVSVGLSRGWLLPGGGVAVSSGSGFIELDHSAPSQSQFSVTTRAWWPRSPLHVRAALVELRALTNPDAGKRLYLGGTPGLRGYRQNAFSGSSSLLLVVEERRYFNWAPLGLFRPGLVVFAEGGLIDGRGRAPLAAAESAGTLHASGRVHGDVGFGLRIASLRSAGGAGIRLDVAFPLEKTTDRGRRPLVVVGYRGDF